MKTLDDAVIELNGVWPSKSDLCVYMVEYVSPKVWSAGSQVANWLFTKEQFTQRAKELGFVGKYRWGVEYPTDGKKLDLDDDVFVKIDDSKLGEDSVKRWRWSSISSFRIIDPRYKPQDTSYLQAEAVESTEEVAQCDWYDYENQEMKTLPDNNTDVELLMGGVCHCRVEYVGRRGFQVVFYRYDTHEIDHAELPTASFRPLDWNRKAEAEKKRVVDSAIEAMRPNPLTGTMEKWFGKLYDLGCLRLPPEKN